MQRSWILFITKSAFACVLLVLMMVDFAIGQEADSESTLLAGSRFECQQYISGVGIISSYRSINNEPLMLASHSKGSGYYASDSSILDKRDVDIYRPYEDYVSSDRSVLFNENISSVYYFGSAEGHEYQSMLFLGMIPIPTIEDL